MADKKNSVTGKRKERSNEDEEEEIVWPPSVIVENTRLRKMEDGRWTGIGNQEMAQILQENGHTQGKPKSSWGKDGHRGIIVIQYKATAEGLQEAQRLHEFFEARGRSRDSWERIRPFWHALPGHEGLDESSDFVVEDDKSGQRKRVLYGYLALVKDAHKVPLKKKQLGCVTVRPSEILQLGPAASHFRTRRVWDAFDLEGKKKAAAFNRQGKKAAAGAAACRPAGA